MTLALVDNDPLITTLDPSGASVNVDIDFADKQVGDWLLAITAIGQDPRYAKWTEHDWQRWARSPDNGFASLSMAFIRVDSTIAAATTSTMEPYAGGGASNEEAAIFVYHLRGGNLELIVPQFDHSVSGGTTTSPDPPSLTTGYGVVEHLWIAGVYHSSGGSTSAGPSGYTNLATSETGAVGLATAIKTSTAASEDPGTFTWGTARTAGQFTIGIPTQEFSPPAGDYPTPTRRYTVDHDSGATFTVPLPADLTGFGTIIKIVAREETIATPTGWTLLGSDDDPLNVVEYAAFYRQGGGGDQDFTLSASTTAVAHVSIYDDVDFSTDPPTIELSPASGSSTVDPPAETFASGDYYIECGEGHTSNDEWLTQPTNYLTMEGIRTLTSSTDSMISNTLRAVAGTSEDPGTYTLTGSRTQVAYTIAVPGVAGGQDVAVGQATEVETANPITARISRLVGFGQASEAETANPITARISRVVPVGTATERELAQTITPNIVGPIIVDVGQVTERELANPIVPFIQGLEIGDIACTVVAPSATCAILSPTVECEIV